MRVKRANPSAEQARGYLGKARIIPKRIEERIDSDRTEA
jgi:hypothetical protein